MSINWEDFDRYVEENKVPPEQIPDALAQWLADSTGQAIIGGPKGESPSVVALPDGPSMNDPVEYLTWIVAQAENGRWHLSGRDVFAITQAVERLKKLEAEQT